MSSETVGQRIHRLRKERGYSQRDVAGLEVSASYISYVERGIRRPSIQALRDLARNLGVSAEYLETGTDDRAEEIRAVRLLDAEIRLRMNEDPKALEKEFREVFRDAIQAGDHAAIARARIGLGLVAVATARFSFAAKHLSKAIDDPSVTPASRPDVFLGLALAWTNTGALGRATELLQRCLETVEHELPEDGNAFVRYATHLCYALDDAGDTQRADEIRARAARCVTSDPHTHARVLWAEARRASADGRLSSAIDLMYRVIGLVEACNNDFGLGRAHLLLASMQLTVGALDHVQQHVEVAEALLARHSDSQLRVALLTTKARLLARTGEGASGLGLVREARNLADASDRTATGLAIWAEAECHAALGDGLAAAAAFREAAPFLRQNGREAEEFRRAWKETLSHFAGAPTTPLF